MIISIQAFTCCCKWRPDVQTYNSSQRVLKRTLSPLTSACRMQTPELDTAASVSRIGGRALFPALRDLALSARLEMVQALDANEFSASKSDPANAKALRRAAQFQMALLQAPGTFVSLEEQVSQGGLAVSMSLLHAFKCQPIV